MLSKSLIKQCIKEIIQGDDCKKEELDNKTNNILIGKKCVIRTMSAGVFFGTLVTDNGEIVVVKNSRMLWGWTGALSVIDIAENGVNPNGCKFSVTAMGNHRITGVLQIIEASKRAIISIEGVAVWVA